MNKSERSNLASIISKMIYSFESGSQLVSAGKLIMYNFPSIIDLVESDRSYYAYTNVRNCIRTSIYERLGESMELAKTGSMKQQKFYHSISVIFDSYLEDFYAEDSDSHLYEIEQKLAISVLRESVISDLLSSDNWKAVASRFYDTGTVEFKHLTNTLI